MCGLWLGYRCCRGLLWCCGWLLCQLWWLLLDEVVIEAMVVSFKSSSRHQYDSVAFRWID